MYFHQLTYKDTFPQLPLPKHRRSIFGGRGLWSTSRDWGLDASRKGGFYPSKWIMEKLAGKGMILFWIVFKT